MSRYTRRSFLKMLASGSAACAAGSFINCASEPVKPNIVFILIDDLGWADPGCYGSRFHETPNIDRMAKEGMRFTDGYAACPVCSPTRASVMTGKYPARLRLTNYLVGQRWPEESPIAPVDWRHMLPAEEVTIAEMLKSAGYATGHIGKWHLGATKEFWPENQGFDVNIGGCQSGMPKDFFWPDWENNPPIRGRFDGEYLPDRLADEAVTFIENNRDRPFFLYLCHYAVHVPIQSKKEYAAKFKEKVSPGDPQNNPIYAGMLKSVDESVGKVTAALERLGLDDRTIVFFMSDNGGLSVPEGPKEWNTPATSNAPLRDGKGYLYEGGVREPWIVRWPGVVAPGGTCGEPVTSVDFYPTILDMAGLGDDPGHVCDGASIVPLLKQTGGLDREAIFWHYPHYSNQGGRPGGSVRAGDWKLIERYEDGSLELFNLRDDIGERKNLSGGMPGKAKELRAKLDSWRKSVGAQMPERKTQ